MRLKFDYGSAAVGMMAGIGGTLLAFAASGPERFGFLYETVKAWQTLAGGMLAIVAALLTVRQMQASDADQWERHRDLINNQMELDRRQSDRHLDLVALQLRADRLRLERIFFEVHQLTSNAFKNLRTGIKRIAQFETEIVELLDSEFSEEKKRKLQPHLSALNQINAANSDIGKLVRPDFFADVADLFEPQLKMDFEGIGVASIRLFYLTLEFQRRSEPEPMELAVKVREIYGKEHNFQPPREPRPYEDIHSLELLRELRRGTEEVIKSTEKAEDTMFKLLCQYRRDRAVNNGQK